MGFQLVPASYLILRRGEEVLLSLRGGTGWRDGYWSLPAGHIEAGESAMAACLREAVEEIGIVVRPDDLVPLCTVHRTGGSGKPVDERVDFFFAAEVWAGEPTNLEPDKCAELGWYGLKDLPTPVVEPVDQVLAGLLSGRLPAIFATGRFE
ncbi:NUDIX hydrolase [Tenggerimyces flavus]|uniref:NUDIX domain-containing protein n=1 Tax=Tenggerimyces flavus TaxID=1708749 RepID=A0ABV7Y9R0_9ACTN|nr:NUDIX domain-containing protein [Tenggerimyces flavus]MBM7791101.1 8-oxo-dGTP pyrophosphatase MutT (NUDIX family) [Tenggerimyces flavus]